MTSIADLAGLLTEVLETMPNQVARAHGCIQRQGKFTGASLVSTLVLGWLGNPQATLEELAQMAAACGVEVSAQGIDQRFSAPLVAVLRDVLAHAVGQVVTGDPVALPLLERFTGVYIQDCSTISLPAALASAWPGCGGQAGVGTAAIKLGVQLDLLAGQLDGPHLGSGRTHDRRVLSAAAPPPAGSLWMADLGLVTIQRLRTIAARGGYFLTRVTSQTHLTTADGVVWTQRALLEHSGAAHLELAVRLGKAARLPVRLLAIRVPAEVAEERRERLRVTASRKQQALSAERLALCAWSVYVTNLSPEQLTLMEALALVRARWQIELLFKLWKSHAQLATSRSQRPQRVHAELFAKLIGVVLQHWLILTAAWGEPARSLVKLAQVARAHVVNLASHRATRDQLQHELTVLRRCLRAGTRINTRATDPHTYQLLANPALGRLA